jgi:hypothetical protein
MIVMLLVEDFNLTFKLLLKFFILDFDAFEMETFFDEI